MPESRLCGSAAWREFLPQFLYPTFMGEEEKQDEGERGRGGGLVSFFPPRRFFCCTFFLSSHPLSHTRSLFSFFALALFYSFTFSSGPTNPSLFPFFIPHFFRLQPHEAHVTPSFTPTSLVLTWKRLPEKKPCLSSTPQVTGLTTNPTSLLQPNSLFHSLVRPGAVANDPRCPQKEVPEASF